MIWMSLAFYVIVGAIVGSFALCYVMRAKYGESMKDLVLARSCCDSCQMTLKRYELLPVFSRVMQKGRCRGCGHRIGYKYVAVELVGAMLFLLLGSYIFPLPLELQLYLGAIVSGLYIIGLYDIYYKELDLKVYGVVVVLVMLLYGELLRLGVISEVGVFVGRAAGIWFVGRGLVRFTGLLIAKAKTGIWKEGFGFGDVLVGGLLGSLLPFVSVYGGAMSAVSGAEYDQLLYNIAFFVFTALISSILGITGFLLFNKQGDYLPFLPYMIGGFVITLVLVLKFGLFIFLS